jgi:cytoskeletal protein RodZ
MSLTAVLVMAAVVLLLLGAWLIAVFLAARQPAGGHAHPGGHGAARAAGQQIDPRGAGTASAQDTDMPPEQADQGAAHAGKAGPPPARAARDA